MVAARTERKKAFVIAMMLLMVTFSGLGALLWSADSVSATGDHNSAEWIIDYDLVIGSNLTCQANITIVDGGTLTVRDATLQMASSTPGNLTIVVGHGGSLILENAEITSYPHTFGAETTLGILIENGGLLKMTDSTLMFPGHLVVDNARLEMHSSSIQGISTAASDRTHSPVFMGFSADVVMVDSLITDIFTGDDPATAYFNHTFATETALRQTVEYNVNRYPADVTFDPDNLTKAFNPGSYYLLPGGEEAVFDGFDLGGLVFDADEYDLHLNVHYRTVSGDFAATVPVEYGRDGVLGASGIEIEDSWTPDNKNPLQIEKANITDYSSVELSTMQVAIDNTDAVGIQIERVFVSIEGIAVDSYRNITMAGDSSFLAIDSILPINFNDAVDERNALVLMDSSQAYFYGVTFEDPAVGDAPHGRAVDFIDRTFTAVPLNKTANDTTGSDIEDLFETDTVNYEIPSGTKMEIIMNLTSLPEGEVSARLLTYSASDAVGPYLNYNVAGDNYTSLIRPNTGYGPQNYSIGSFSISELSEMALYLEYDLAGSSYFDSIFLEVVYSPKLYIYKWADVTVENSLGTPIHGATLNAKEQIGGAVASYLPDDGDASVPPQEVLDHMGRTSVDFNVTDVNGKALIPLLTGTHSNRGDTYHTWEITAVSAPDLYAVGSGKISFGAYPYLAPELNEDSYKELTLSGNVSQIELSDPYLVRDGGTTWLAVDVINTGDAATLAFDVNITVNGTSIGTNNSGPLAVGETATFMQSFVQTAPGVLMAQATVESADQLVNGSSSSADLTVNLEIVQFSTTPSGDDLSTDQEVTLSFRIANNGVYAAENVNVTIAFSEDGGAPVMLYYEVIGLIPAGGTYDGSYTWDSRPADLTSSSVNFTITVNYGEFIAGGIPESDYSANVVYKDFDFTDDRPDLALDSIDFDATVPYGKTLDIEYTIINNGLTDANDARVTIYLLDGAARISIANLTVDVDAGQTYVGTVSWKVLYDLGVYDIEAHVNEFQEIEEIGYGDNSITEPITIDAAAVDTWTIDSDLVLTSDMNVYENIVIDGATLTLRNVNLRMVSDKEDGYRALTITVTNGGSLVMENSRIEAHAGSLDSMPILGIIVEDGGEIVMRDSSMAFAGHLVLDDASLEMHSSTISGLENSYVGLVDPSLFPADVFSFSPVLTAFDSVIVMTGSSVTDIYQGGGVSDGVYNFHYDFASDDKDRSTVTYTVSSGTFEMDAYRNINLVNSTITAIDSVLPINYDDDPDFHNALVLVDESAAYLYGVTAEDPITGSYPYLDTFQFTDRGLGTPLVFIYKWVEVSVQNSLGDPIGGASLTARLQTDSSLVVYHSPAGVSNVPPAEVLAYLGKDASDFNVTAADGTAVLPLLTNQIDRSQVTPVKHHSYVVTAYSGPAGYPIGADSISHSSYPYLLPELNADSYRPLDIAVNAPRLSLSDPYLVRDGGTTWLAVDVINTGDAATLAFDVNITVNGTSIGTNNSGPLAVGETATFMQPFVQTAPGNLLVEALVTSDDGLIDGANSSADLSTNIRIENFLTFPSQGTQLQFGNPFMVSYTIGNDGPNIATDVKVEIFYSESPGIPPTLVHTSKIPQINVGATWTNGTSLGPIEHSSLEPSAQMTFSLVINNGGFEEGGIPETDYDDNIANITFNYADQRPLLVFESVETPVNAPFGKTIDIGFTVNNTGGTTGQAAARVTMYLVDGSDRIQIVNTTTTSDGTPIEIAGSSVFQDSVSWKVNVPEGNYTLEAFVNEFGVIDVRDDADNSLTTFINVDALEPAITVAINRLTFNSGEQMIVTGIVTNKNDASRLSGQSVSVAVFRDGVKVAEQVTITNAQGFYLAEITATDNMGGQIEVRSTVNVGDESSSATLIASVKPAVSVTDQPIWVWLLIIAILIAIIAAFTVYVYRYSLGKMAECGECHSLIPEAARRCPNCGTDFETGTAKCSECNSWIPASSTSCPECSASFVGGLIIDEKESEYVQLMREGYESFVDGYREKVREDLGKKYSDTKFIGIWKEHPEYISFEDWLAREEGKRTEKTFPCPSCGTPNVEGSKSCYRCGNVFEPPQEDSARRVVRRESTEEKPEIKTDAAPRKKVVVKRKAPEAKAEPEEMKESPEKSEESGEKAEGEPSDKATGESDSKKEDSEEKKE